MENIKLSLEYDGTNYHGWQIQPNIPTVQGKIQDALKSILRQKVTVISAGRTDKGVHAKGQIISFKISCYFPPRQLLLALNSVLPKDIRVREAQEVAEDFHARYSACYKVYRYLIYNGIVLPPWFRNFSWWR